MKIFKLKVIYIAFFLFVFLFSHHSYADKIKEFKIIGNERLATETIILFSDFNIGDEINQNDINNSFKKLFDTNYFQNINIKFVNGVLSIQVIENPIVEKIDINGIGNNSIYSEIEKITEKTEKYPFIKSNFVDQKNQILNKLKEPYLSKYYKKFPKKINDIFKMVYKVNAFLENENF